MRKSGKEEGSKKSLYKGTKLRESMDINGTKTSLARRRRKHESKGLNCYHLEPDKPLRGGIWAPEHQAPRPNSIHTEHQKSPQVRPSLSPNRLGIQCGQEPRVSPFVPKA